MDVRNSTLVAGAALFLAITLTCVTVSGLWYYGPPTRPVDPIRPLPTRPARMPDRSNVVAQLASARTQAAELETRLADAQRELASRTRALQRSEKSNKELKEELDRSLNLALQLLSPMPPKDNGESKQTTEEQRPADDATQEAVAELERLRQQVNDNEQEMVLLELSSDEEAAQLLANSRAFRDEIVRVVARIGAPGVAAILPALEDDQASVREWAAVVLGRMGPRAAEATVALREAAEHDQDERVRNAARRALMRVAD